jgi:aerobic-type carbon monoxide dehydrogenase small subunit (CoxS/CutS family)
VEGAKITTIEGLASDKDLTDLQESFIQHGAVQCGFCTSGMLMSADALLKRDKNPDTTAIRQSLAGNICRCTGYAKIIEAVSHASSPNEHCDDRQLEE